MPRFLTPVRAVLAIAAVAAVGLAMASPAAAAGPTTQIVLAADLSAANASAGTTSWDAASGQQKGTLPATGTKWILDIEDKLLGGYAITADGLMMSVIAPGASSTWTKVRYQYYLGSGGYPAIDPAPGTARTLAEMLNLGVAWDVKYLSGDTTYGPVLQIKLQKLLQSGLYARVTVVSNWSNGSASSDLSALNWFANTDIYSLGYPTGFANGYGAAGSSGTKLNRATSGPGVDKATLITNFGDFEVVSFGPNLGRDKTYSYAVQNLTAFGQTFVFSEHAPVTPSASPSASTPATSTGTRTTSFVAAPTPTPTAEELPTLSVPPETATPSPSEQADPPADETVVAEPTSDAQGFPWWILLIVGFAALIVTFLAWLFRRNSA